MAKRMNKLKAAQTLLALSFAVGAVATVNAQTAQGQQMTSQSPLSSGSNGMSTQAGDVAVGAFRPAASRGDGGQSKNEIVVAVNEASSNVGLHLSEKGEIRGDVSLVTTRGNRRDVVTALRVIVPRGWSGFSSDDAVKKAPKVSWRYRNRPWTEALSEVLAQAGLKAVVNWDKKEVEVMAYVGPPAADTLAVSQATPISQAPASARSSQAAVQAKDGGASRRVEDQSIRKVQIEAERVAKIEAEIARQAELEALAELRREKRRDAVMTGQRHEAQMALSVVPSTIVPAPPQPGAISAQAVEAAPPPEQKLSWKDLDDAESADAVATVIQAQKDRPLTGLVTKVSAPTEVSKKAAGKLQSIRSVGAYTTASTTVRGAGFNIPIFAALSEVSPRGWIIYSKDGALSNKMLVAWRGGNRPWLQVLDEVLTENNLYAVIKHDSKEIQIAAAP
jgi:hypothetical protein